MREGGLRAFLSVADPVHSLFQIDLRSRCVLNEKIVINKIIWILLYCIVTGYIVLKQNFSWRRVGLFIQTLRRRHSTSSAFHSEEITEFYPTSDVSSSPPHSHGSCWSDMAKEKHVAGIFQTLLTFLSCFLSSNC